MAEINDRLPLQNCQFMFNALYSKGSLQEDIA